MDALTILKPDDWHVHLRDGAALASVVGFTAERFGRAIVMPNLKPPIATTALAAAYVSRIRGPPPPGGVFSPLCCFCISPRRPPLGRPSGGRGADSCMA